MVTGSQNHEKSLPTECPNLVETVHVTADQFLPQEVIDHRDVKASEHPLAAKINRFIATQNTFLGKFQSTGFSRANYLDVVHSQVKVMRQYQNAQGQIIDPVTGFEMYYSTPCYAHCVATLVKSGFDTDPNLLNSGIRAMDVGVNHLYNDTAPSNHGDFFIWPLMLALDKFIGIATNEKINEWTSKLSAINPSAVYDKYNSLKGNWALVHTAGEFLRYKKGMTTTDYVKYILAGHLDNFTEYGMYNEGPLPYDHFARLFIAGMLNNGYRDNYFQDYHKSIWKGVWTSFLFIAGMLNKGYRCNHLLDYHKVIWKGAWTSLFIQSPFGELPTGGRSSHHIWNEAESAVTFEIYANQYALLGRMDEAGAFKRAAHLSLKSILNWIRPDGSGYIVKNHYPIEAKHGYESYSEHTCYNLLACSMLSEAWAYANDMIAEQPSPADIGGFVIYIPNVFHKIFANANGNYIECDTSGDHKYNPTGLIRVHLKGGHPQLGPSDGCAPEYSGTGVNYAVGPAWRDSSGLWHSLAEQKPSVANVEILNETPEEIEFSVSYALARGVSIGEHYKVNKNGVFVEDQILGAALQSMRIYYPALFFNGKDKTSIDAHGNHVVMRLEGKEMAFALTEPQHGNLNRTGQVLVHRNGLMEIFYSELTSYQAKYHIYVPVPGDFDKSGR